MGLEWALCDSRGRTLSMLTDRQPGSEVAVGLGLLRTASVRIPIEDEAAALVRPFETRLKAWLDGACIMNGAVVPYFAGGSAMRGGTGGGGVASGTVEISAIGPDAALEDAYTKGFAAQEDIDQGEIMARLVEHADDQRAADDVPSHGIVRGSIEPSVTRDRSYFDGKQVREAIVELSQVRDGAEFDFTPLDRTDGTFAELNVFHPRMGTNKSAAVVLEYNVGRHNASAFSWEPGGGELYNRYVMAGAPDPDTGQAQAWVAYNLASQRRYGVWSGFEVRPDITELATLREHAEEIVAARAFPIDFVQITPVSEQGGVALPYYRGPYGDLRLHQPGEGFAAAPRFGPAGDYWIGDDIGLLIREKPGVDLDLRARVDQARIVEADEAGTVMVELECNPYSDAAGVQGHSTTVQLERSAQTPRSRRVSRRKRRKRRRR